MDFQTWGFGTQGTVAQTDISPGGKRVFLFCKSAVQAEGGRPGVRPVYKAPAFTLPAREEPDGAQLIFYLALQRPKQDLPPVGLGKQTSLSCHHRHGHRSQKS